MSVFQMYCDETGTHRKDGTVRVIGLMGWHRFWPELDKEWCGVLNAEPRTRFWHTTSARQGRLITPGPPERPLCSQEAETKELALCKLMGSRAEHMVTIEVSLSMKDHAAHVAGKVKSPSKFKKTLGPLVEYVENPVFIAMRTMVLHSMGLARAWNQRVTPKDPFHVWSIFEQNESNADFQFDLGVSVEVLRRMMTPEARQALGPVIFLPGKGPLAQTTLQAADLFAWHVNRISETGAAQPGWEALSRITRNQLPITAADLDAMVQSVNGGSRIDI